MLKRFLAVTALSINPAMAEMSENVISIPTPLGCLVGTLAIPDGEPAPAVLLLHGFMGNRDELVTEHVGEGVFARTAAKLAEAGYASLRIDFRGSGESLDDLTFAETTFEGQIADAMAAFEFLSDHEEVVGSDVSVIGWSQGGLVAVTLAGRTNAPRSLVLWNAVGEPDATFRAIFGDEGMAAGYAADANTSVTVTLPWGVSLDLNGAFFDGVESLDPLGEIAGYTGPVLALNGTDDPLVATSLGQAYADAASGPGTASVLAMDHVFNTFGTDVILNNMIAGTIGFLEQR